MAHASRFAQLYQQGDSTVCERKQMLLEHAEHLARERAVLDRCSELLTYKLARYQEIMGAGT